MIFLTVNVLYRLNCLYFGPAAQKMLPEMTCILEYLVHYYRHFHHFPTRGLCELNRPFIITSYDRSGRRAHLASGRVSCILDLPRMDYSIIVSHHALTPATHPHLHAPLCHPTLFQVMRATIVSATIQSYVF